MTSHALLKKSRKNFITRRRILRRERFFTALNFHISLPHLSCHSPLSDLHLSFAFFTACFDFNIFWMFDEYRWAMPPDFLGPRENWGEWEKNFVFNLIHRPLSEKSSYFRPAAIEIGDRNPIVSVILTWLAVIVSYILSYTLQVSMLYFESLSV